MDHLARGLEVGALAEIVAAEADGGNAQAGAAEIANLHGSILWEEAREEAHCGPRQFARKQRGYRPPRLAAMRHKKMRPRSDAATDGDRLGRVI